ncbi:unnamed protein product [Brassica oleracea]
MLNVLRTKRQDLPEQESSKDEPIDKSKHWGDLEEEEQEEEMDEEELEDGMESVDTLSSTPTGTETPNEIEAEKGIR